MDLQEFYKALEKDLKEKFGDKTKIWVWPSYNGVKGFFGNGIIENSVVIWITERPSSARDKTKLHKFPDWIDKIFYKIIKEESFQNMHLTDFVKIMTDAGVYPTKEELEVSALWMGKEIETLKVNNKKLIIIANSKNVAKWMKKYLPEYPLIYKDFFKRIIRFNPKEKREEVLRAIFKEIKLMLK